VSLPDVLIAAKFWEDYGHVVEAAVIVIVSIAIAKLVDWGISSRAGRLSKVVPGVELSPVASTRLRLVRRLISATIILIGFAVALSRFPSLKTLAASLLASSAVLGLVVGFAARQVLANAVAGVLLAITQPIRIGDLITFEDDTGVVEDIQLTYTYVRAGDGRRVVIPNERLAQSTIENHTIVDPRVHVEVSVWIPPYADIKRALELAVQDEDGVDASVAEVDKEGVRIVVGAWAQHPDERGAMEAGLRARCLERLQRGSILSGPPNGA
jgi:small-conductance mechanosensitive channel